MSNPPEPLVSPAPIVCVPMKLDAFRLNNASCNHPSRLAPFSQPEYANFRLDEDFRKRMEHDVLQTVDFHNTGRDTGHLYSNRVTDLATGNEIRSRHGIYLHWILPRFYRTGLAITHSTPDEAAELRNKLGYKPPYTDDPHSPIYRPLPTRWIVVRHITNELPEEVKLPVFAAFVIESDRLRKLADLDSKIDIQVDVSPFVYLTKHLKSQFQEDGTTAVDGELRYQGENFIGFKRPLEDWKEETAHRVTLSTVNTFNPVFADYQPHNSNVFSMLDNFAYPSTGGNGKPITKYADIVLANYYVIGWHDDQNDDPFHDGNADRLEACFMQLASGGSPDSITKDSRLIIHGAIYDVSWRSDAVPKRDPNEDVTELYESYLLQNTPNYSPIAVGGSPLDALIAVTHAHVYPDKPPQMWSPLAQDLLALQTLVHKFEEDPDSQLQGADALHTSCFIPSDGGLHWHILGTTDAKKPVVPTEKELKDLNAVNEYQMFVDLCLREMKSVQWLIWAEWWKWITRGPEREKDKSAVADRIKKLVESYKALKKKTEETKSKIKGITDPHKKWESVPAPRYYIAKDPTVLLCGMTNPWPIDYTEPLATRLDSQLTDDIPPSARDFKTFRDQSAQSFPNQLQDTVKMLLAEFYNLRESSGQWKNPPPLYHDILGRTKGPEPIPKRDNWNETQPWFTLFVEWEIEYLHIHKDLWEPAEREAYGPPMLRSKIVDKDGNRHIDLKNIRVLSGRELIVPQIGMMLKNAVEQLLKIKSPDDMELLKKIHDTLHKIPFLNITLSGIRDQLATRHRGTYCHLCISDIITRLLQALTLARRYMIQ